MQTLTEEIFKLAPPAGLFDESALRALYPDRSTGAIRLLVHRAVRHGEVLRLRPGLFCLSGEFRKTHPHPFVLAAVLHAPSHISMESALAYHGLIPEAVFVVASVTSRRSRSFKTPLGHFSFVRVPAEYPRAGVRSVKVDTTGWAFVAGPVRAIADLVYARRDVRWEVDGPAFLIESMRIEEEDLHELSMDDVEDILGSVRNRRVGRYLRGLRREIEA